MEIPVNMFRPISNAAESIRRVLSPGEISEMVTSST